MTEQLSIRPLSGLQLRKIYRQWVCRDFPAEERKPLWMIRRSLARGGYETLGLFDGETAVGYAFFAKTGGRYLLDYYAIDVPHRDKGFGSAFLRLLTANLTAAETLIIEVEHPETAEGDEQKLRQRRLQFYLRCGCRETGVSADVFGVRYLLLEQPLKREHSTAEIRTAYAALYRSFLPEKLFRRNIAFVGKEDVCGHL